MINDGLDPDLITEVAFYQLMVDEYNEDSPYVHPDSEEVVKQSIKYVVKNWEKILDLAEQKKKEADIRSVVDQLREIRDRKFVNGVEAGQIDQMIWRLENLGE